MARITSLDLKAALKGIGLGSGDTVLLHSDLRPFGLPAFANSNEEILRFYYDGLLDVLGKEGTLAVPAYFYEYARYGIPFDTETSPVSKPLGVFSSYINSLPGRVRSCNPIQSIASIGKQAEELCGGGSLSGYGITSPWQRLRKMGGKIAFLGTSIQPMTYVHYIEQHYGVPHLYCKIYPYPVSCNKQPIAGNPISAVRYLHFGVEYELSRFQSDLKTFGALNEAKLNGASLLSVNAEDAFRIGIQMLDKDPYYFLKKPPSFIRGKIPLDGIS